jgi:hypothetical protein
VTVDKDPVTRSRMSRSFISSPLSARMAFVREVLRFTLVSNRVSSCGIEETWICKYYSEEVRRINLSSKWNSEVSFTPRLFYPRERQTGIVCKWYSAGPTARGDNVAAPDKLQPHTSWRQPQPAWLHYIDSACINFLSNKPSKVQFFLRTWQTLNWPRHGWWQVSWI